MRILLSRLLACVALAALLGPGVSDAEQLSNINGVHDPSRMVYDPDGNRWIIWWTGNGIPIATSTDKVTWTRPNPNTVFPPGHPLRADYWAPDMWDTPIHGKYYLFYSQSSFGSQNSSVKVASATSLTSSNWVFEGNVVTSVTGDPFNAIDPAPFYDPVADRLWVTFGSFWTGMYITEVNPLNPSERIGEFTHLAGGRFNGSHPTNPGGLAGTNAMEGPYIFYRNGWYYLNVAVDSCCRGASSTYKMIIGRSRSITGPYLDRDGVDLKTNGGTIFMAGSGPELGPGQFARYELNGEDRFTYHFYLTNGQSRHGGRRMEWGADDWPKAVYPATIPRGIYRIRKNTNLRLAVRGESTNPVAEAHIEQDSAEGRPSQNWLFVPHTSAGGNTYYTIQNVATRFVLDVADGHREEGDYIRQWFPMDLETNESQQWRVIAVGDTAGNYQIQSVRSGRVPGVVPTSLQPFATVVQRDWQFTPGTFRDTTGATVAMMQTDLKYQLEPVVDTDPPVLTLPADITVPATSPNGAVVTFAATAQDAISGAVPVKYSIAPGSQFPIGTTMVEVTAADDLFNTATDTFSVTVVRQLSALGPATVWLGLTNSDDVGLRLDVRADVLVNGVKVGGGEVDNVLAGSSGFNNAARYAIPLALTNGPVAVPPDAQVQVAVSVRRSCTGGGHASGTVRLWFNGQPVDAGATRDAGSRFRATIAGAAADYFLRGSSALAATAGSSRLAIDRGVNNRQACTATGTGRDFTPFGTWSIPLP